MKRLDNEIARASGGRIRFDVRRQELRVMGEGGRTVAQVVVKEAALRNWMQRLLLNAPDRLGGDSEPEAVRLLVARVREASEAAQPQAALERLVTVPSPARSGATRRRRPKVSSGSACW
jgi:hypothetical protein